MNDDPSIAITCTTTPKALDVLRATGISSGTTLLKGVTGTAASITVNSSGIWRINYCIACEATASTIVYFSIAINGSPPSPNPTRNVQGNYGTTGFFETISNSALFSLTSGDVITLLISTNSASTLSVNVSSATLQVERIQ
jgi:hypothetical protein